MSDFLSQFVATIATHVRDSTSRPGALFVAVAGTGGAAFILVSVLAIAEGLANAMQRAGSDDVAVVTRRDAAVELVSRLSETDIATIASKLGTRTGTADAVVSPETVTLMDTISRGGEAGAQVLGRGLTDAGLKMREHFRIVSGRRFATGKLEVVVGRRIAREFAGLKVGETITGGANEWDIVGVFEDGGGLSESEVWMDLDMVRSEAGGTRGAGVLRIQLDSAAKISALRAAIEVDPRVQVRVDAERSYYARQSIELINRVQFLALGLALLLGLGALVASINTMYAAISARQSAIATMRALGFRASPIAAAIVAESTLIGLTSGLIGGIFAYLLANGADLSLLNLATATPISFDLDVSQKTLLCGVAVGCVLGLMGGVPPAVSMARTPITAGLRQA